MVRGREGSLVCVCVCTYTDLALDWLPVSTILSTKSIDIYSNIGLTVK